MDNKPRIETAMTQEGCAPAGPGNPLGGPPNNFAGSFAGVSDSPDGPPPGGITTFMPVDPITGANNMPVFITSFKEDVLHAELDKPATWYIDIRDFRSINPKYGFLKGNIILRALVNSIKANLAGDFPVARLGADRFVFVSQGLDYEAAIEKFQTVADFVNTAAVSSGVNTPISLIGGIYYLRDLDYKADNHNRALDYASVAHRNAKRETGTALVLFTDEDLERDMRRITLEQSIDSALEKGQIEVWYQPQVDYIYGDVVGAEALARWNHPELGWVPPSEFIPVLENCGKIHKLDLFVWEEACRSAGRWRNVSDGKPIPISVNVSRAEVYEDDLVDHFLELMSKYDLPEGSLHLEVTESAFVEEADRLFGVVENLRAHNTPVEMDDFGSGLSSLNMLKDIPVDVVKLDMGFMRSTMNAERGGVVLGAVIRMLQGLNTPIIAEGVETLAQAETLKNMGCHLMQGFHFSRPMPLQEFESYIASNKAIDRSARLKRGDTKIENLASFDTASSFLFNEAMGATLFFFIVNDKTESILVNDAFYEACGLDREVFGDAKINPVAEIDEESQSVLWRASAEAREYGASQCRAKVRLTGRWIDCIMRYIGTSTRGEVFSLNIYRWSDKEDDLGNLMLEETHERAWALSILDKVVPAGFVKCAVDKELTVEFASPAIIKNSGLAEAEFKRRYHNSLVDFVTLGDRSAVLEAVRREVETGQLIECKFDAYYGYDGERSIQMLGRIEKDGDDRWLYAILFFLDVTDASDSGTDLRENSIIPFEYHYTDDKLFIRDVQPDGTEREVVVEGFLAKLDKANHASASQALATIRDLHNHPVSGFMDMKSNLRGGSEDRWYHINYSCETDESGKAVIARGYAQDANDHIGSAKWWRRQAERDQLTGLLGRNAAERNINLSMRAQGTGMMFMIDLDGFKRVNDDLGHITGDALLRDVADALSAHFRESDVLGRYGGDEFVAFVPVANGDPHQIAERRSSEIIEAVSAIEVPDGTHAGCSIGVAISHSRESTFYELLEVADQAMYQSKLSGKGKYTIIDMEQR